MNEGMAEFLQKNGFAYREKPIFRADGYYDIVCEWSLDDPVYGVLCYVEESGTFIWYAHAAVVYVFPDFGDIEEAYGRCRSGILRVLGKGYRPSPQEQRALVLSGGFSKKEDFIWTKEESRPRRSSVFPDIGFCLAFRRGWRLSNNTEPIRRFNCSVERFVYLRDLDRAYGLGIYGEKEE